MEPQFRRQIGGVGDLRGVEIADVLLSSVDHDLRLPALSTLVQRHAAVTASVVRPWARLILQIHRSRNIPQVCYSIVRPIPVDVVNVMRGHYAMEMQPCQAMRLEFHPVDLDAGVAFAADRSSDCANLDPVVRLHHPPKDSGVGVIVQQASQGFGGGAFHF